MTTTKYEFHLISDLLSHEDIEDFVFTVPFCPDLKFTPDRTFIEVVLDYEDLGVNRHGIMTHFTQ